MKRLLIPAAILLAVLFVAFTKQPGKTAVPADILYIHGKIITVDSANSIAEAVAVKDGKILAVGSLKDINAYKGPNTVVQDLGGKTMIPGIVDGHSHFMSLSRSKSVNLSAPPVGTVLNIADLVAALKKFKSEKHIAAGEWISGYGYDQDQLAEKRHPAKEDLDAAFPDNPVIITHVSGHMLVANSAALKASGIDANTPDPPGGVIVRMPGSKEPSGLLQERASALLKRNPGRQLPNADEQMELFKAQEELYASCGITTAQEGSTSPEAVEFLKKAAAQKALYIDIASLPSYAGLDKMLADTSFHFGVYSNHLKLEGFKLIADGSPQGKTAYFTDPYLTEVPGCSADECRGVPTVTQEQFNEAVLKGFSHNIQTFVHCNGDATIDMYIKAVQYACRQLHTSSLNRRPVVIHSQFVRADQLDKYKELGFVPSFFTNHTFFWGDVHVKNLGQQRGYFESPLKTAEKKGIVFANHTDYGVTPLNQLFLLWSSVARKSRNGVVIGPEERLTPMEGLRALTINGAYLYFDEKIKGSIEKGKLADFAVLSADPLTVQTDMIKDITVLETIKEGKTIYKAK